jgi:tetratricopeptide (TPR) repeat protein
VKRVLIPSAGLALVGLALPAAAQDKDAIEAYSAGNYQAALARTADAPDADSRAFAARVLLSEAICADGQPPDSLLKSALEEANEALSRQPGHIEGRLQKAIALSLISRPLSLSEVRRSGWGEEARNLAEAVLAEDPQNPYAHGLLAVWNVEVLRRGGTVGAMIMGASLERAREHYQAAIELTPGDAAIHWQWARVLAALNAKKYRAEIETALNAALAAPVDSDLEQVMQDRARSLKQVLDTAGPKAAGARAQDML